MSSKSKIGAPAAFGAGGLNRWPLEIKKRGENKKWQ